MKEASQGWEVLNANLRRGTWGAAVFDFDGTLSLIREGWSRIMAQLGMDLLAEQNLPHEGLRDFFEDAMLRLSGKPSIFQMRRLAEIVQERGGVPGNPDEYLQEFLKRLFTTSDERKRRLREKLDSPEVWAVPGAHALLEVLQNQGIPLYLASGTDRQHVLDEAELLGLTRFFGEEIHAPANNTPNFSKRSVFERILARHNLTGEQLLSFGDGFSETVEAKRLGGVAVGLASVEPGESGLHPLKKAMLAELGADVLIADYRDGPQLWHWLTGEG